MSGFAVSMVHGAFPAEMGQVSRNSQSLMAAAAENHATESLKREVRAKHTTVDGSDLKASADRDGDGHAWGPPQRRKQDAPDPHELETLAGEGAIFDRRA